VQDLALTKRLHASIIDPHDAVLNSVLAPS
jgi:hypothetical protein